MGDQGGQQIFSVRFRLVVFSNSSVVRWFSSSFGKPRPWLVSLNSSDPLLGFYPYAESSWHGLCSGIGRVPSKLLVICLVRD
jgi:hypothetical protein